MKRNLPDSLLTVPFPIDSFPIKSSPITSILISLAIVSLLIGLAFPGLAAAQPVFLGERHIFEVTFFKIPVVKVHLEVTQESTWVAEPIYHLAVSAHSTPFYSLLYPVDNQYDAYFTWPHIRTVRYDRRINEPGVNLQRSVQYRQGQAIYDGQEPYPAPLGVRDLFTALYTLRGQPLDDGQVIESLLELDGEVWTARATVTGRTEVETRLGRHRAIEVTVRFLPVQLMEEKRNPSDVMTNNLVREKTKLTLWFSDDEHKTLLRTEYHMAPFSLKSILLETK